MYDFHLLTVIDSRNLHKLKFSMKSFYFFTCLMYALDLYFAETVAPNAERSCSQCPLFLFQGNKREKPGNEAASTRWRPLKVELATKYRNGLDL